MYEENIIMCSSNINELVPYNLEKYDINILIKNLIQFTKNEDIYNEDLEYLEVFHSTHKYLYKDRGYIAIYLPDLLYSDISARDTNFRYNSEIQKFIMNADQEVQYDTDLVLEDNHFRIFFVEDKYTIYPIDKEHFVFLIQNTKELFS